MSDTRSAAILYCPHHYDALRVQAMGIARGLEARGFQVDLLNVKENEHRARAFSKRSNYEFAIGMGAQTIKAKRFLFPLYKRCGRRFYYYLLDPIIHDANRIDSVLTYIRDAKADGRLHFVFPDRSYADLLAGIVPGERISYLPFGAICENGEGNYVERTKRFAVFGTIGKQLGKVGEGDLKENIRHSCKGRLSEQQVVRLAESIQDPTKRANVAANMVEVLNIDFETILAQPLLRTATTIDSFEKNRRRLAIVAELGDVPVDFYGAGWAEHLPQTAHHRYMHSVPYEDLARSMPRYHSVVNFDPNWDDGFHDRVYSALGSGCYVLTNENRALVDLGQHGAGSIVTYNAITPRARETAAELLSRPIMDPSSAVNFQRRFSWEARVARWLEQSGV